MIDAWARACAWGRRQIGRERVNIEVSVTTQCVRLSFGLFSHVQTNPNGARSIANALMQAAELAESGRDAGEIN